MSRCSFSRDHWRKPYKALPCQKDRGAWSTKWRPLRTACRWVRWPELSWLWPMHRAAEGSCGPDKCRQEPCGRQGDQSFSHAVFTLGKISWEKLFHFSYWRLRLPTTSIPGAMWPRACRSAHLSDLCLLPWERGCHRHRGRCDCRSWHLKSQVLTRNTCCVWAEKQQQV